MTDLETAALEWIVYVRTEKNYGNIIVAEARGPECEPTRVIEYSAYAKALKRIEELEGKLAEIKSYMPKVPTEPYEKELAKALTKERQISKLLEEALASVSEIAKYALWQSDAGMALAQKEIDKWHTEGKAGIWVQVAKLLTEVQKLRGE